DGVFESHLRLYSARAPNHGCFFFQAEDGIRDYKVTGVQTCALPIWATRSWPRPRSFGGCRTRCERSSEIFPIPPVFLSVLTCARSEERRVGKECRSRGSS